jgi:GTP-binding protein Era
VLLETIAVMSKRAQFLEVVPISATYDINVDTLIGLIPPLLPVSPPLFPANMQTDRSEHFHYAELIREKLMLSLRQEVPYGLTVQIERFERDESGVAVNAIIWLERDSQKGIVIGKGGAHLKKVGRVARLELKQQLGVPVHLDLWVKVKENWADSDTDLRQLGYEVP